VKITGGRVAAAGLALGVLLAGAVVVAPFIEAAGPVAPVREALERTLGRKVEFRQLSYRLFPFPGLAAADLVIAEDEAFGVEPFAYVTELHAGLKWLPLLRGRYELSAVRLFDASINLARDPQLGWNAGRLIERLARGGGPAGTAPRLLVRAGRINFRSGALKSPYYLTGVTLDLDAAEAPGGAVRWSYEASPARTDRAGQGFGQFSGGGSWDPDAGPEGLADVEVELERSVIGEVLTLLTGRDPGVQGRIAGRARLRGPLHRIAVSGQVQFAELERPGLFGLGARNPAFPFEGRLDLSAQEVEIRSAGAPDAGPPPMQAEFAAGSILVNPRWKARLKVEKLPATTAVDLARRFGAGLPAGLLSEGVVEGVIRASVDGGLEGQLTLRGIALPLGESGAARVAEAQVLFGPGGMELRPARAVFPTGAEAEAHGNWNPAAGGAAFSIDAAKLPVAEMNPVLEIAGADTLPPGLSGCPQGTVSGTLRFERTAASPARWTGALMASGLSCPVEGLPGPLEVDRGDYAVDGARWSLRRAAGRAGELEWEGDVLHVPAAARPWRVQLAIPAASLVQIERLAVPLLEMRRGLLRRTLPFRRPASAAWLSHGGVEGRIRIQALQAGDLPLWGFKSNFFLDRAGLEIPGLEARWKDGEISGRATVRGGGGAPVYAFRGTVESVEWQGGAVDAELELTAPGPAASFGGRVQASGFFTARGLHFGDEHAPFAAGAFEYAAQRGGAALKLRSLEIQSGGETLVGRGAGAEGRLVVEAAGAGRSLRLEGTLKPFTLAPAPGEADRTR
jgi:hypothetical protein